MIKTSFILISSLLIISCASTEEVAPLSASSNLAQTGSIAVTNVDKKTPAVSQPIDFFDSQVFDATLGEALTAGQSTVEVKAISPFTVNQIPQRLDVWLSAAVHEYGGKVETKPDPAYPQSKAIISELVDLAVQVYGAVQKEKTYGAAENYNLTVYYKPGTGTVTKMVFTHK
jgi:hypothetical protein